MRLSAEVLSLSEQRSNALGEREIVLRGLAIPSIENLAASRDQFDAIDLADNRITRVENFPRLQRLSSLFLSGNSIESIDAKNLAKNVSNITNLVLSYNRISGLHEVANIAAGCQKLEFLTLIGNPVTRRQHYRLYAIHKIPTLKVLDFVKVKQQERERAKRLATSAAGAALEGDVKIEAREAARSAIASSGKTFTPGEGRSAKESFIVNFTPEEKAQIRNMIMNAESPAEIEEIEALVKRGIFPGEKNKMGNENGQLNSDLKRKNVTENGDLSQEDSKRPKLVS
mmetsp:Transcript_9263/g.13134  ORF Transcript_9263/g.13134 Transcript_9263/m.13134 type:complete len:285 (-) Transcript_9263:6-860(-)